MVALLAPAELQFCDGNGIPYAGGTIAYYVPGTTTPKNTWSDQGGTVLNTNPVVLDAAGRAIVYGDGAYRMVLSDALGNLIFDQLTSSLVSAAMAPIALAPDIPTALNLLGIPALIAAETAARTAGDSFEYAGRTAGDATLWTSITSLNTAAAASTAALAAETARATAAEAAITAGAGFPVGSRLQFGQATTDATGAATVTFPTPFSGTPTVYMTQTGAASGCIVLSYGVTNASFLAYSSKSFTTGDGLGPVSFAWLAMGPL